MYLFTHSFTYYLHRLNLFRAVTTECLNLSAVTKNTSDVLTTSADTPPDTLRAQIAVGKMSSMSEEDLL